MAKISHGGFGERMLIALGGDHESSGTKSATTIGRMNNHKNPRYVYEQLYMEQKNDAYITRVSKIILLPYLDCFLLHSSR